MCDESEFAIPITAEVVPITGSAVANGITYGEPAALSFTGSPALISVAPASV